MWRAKRSAFRPVVGGQEGRKMARCRAEPSQPGDDPGMAFRRPGMASPPNKGPWRRCKKRIRQDRDTSARKGGWGNRDSRDRDTRNHTVRARARRRSPTLRRDRYPGSRTDGTGRSQIAECPCQEARQLRNCTLPASGAAARLEPQWQSFGASKHSKSGPSDEGIGACKKSQWMQSLQYYDLNPSIKPTSLTIRRPTSPP